MRRSGTEGIGWGRKWLACIGSVLAIGAAAAHGALAVDDPVVLVSNPYADVDWATFGTFKGNLHTHTTQSDGNQAPSAVIDGYKAQNYDILAITDHDKVTYPWATYGRDPLVVGMTDVQGNELSQGHHIVSLFSGYASSSADETTQLSGVAAAGGISFFAHPGRYSQTAQWYADHYLAQPSCIGQEIYNQGDRYAGDRVKWDQVLSLLMPNRPVWGFSNDDSHDASHIGKNRTYMLAPSVSHADVRAALENGAFYATYSTSSAHVPPAITNVVVDELEGTITVQGTGYTQVRWISQGTQVGTGETLDLVSTLGVAKYVRAELHGPEGIAYSNPFGLLPTGNQAPVVNAGPDRSVTLPNAAALSGSASDDSLPNPPGALTLEWTKVSGPGTVTFANAAAAQTTATFSDAGTYILRLTANDRELQSHDEMTVTVLATLPGIQVGPTGSGTLTFDALPPASEWATSSIGTGKDGFTTAPGLDAGVQTLNQSAVTETLIGETSASPTKRNRAVWTSGGSKFIQISSTSVGAVLLKATLVNASGEAISSLRVAYDYTVSGTQSEEVPGLRAFYSLTGTAGSWVLIPEFSGLMTSQALETALTFGTPWQPGAQMLLMWADDNSAADDERKYQIDNFSAAPASLPLSVALAQPADGATFAKNQEVTVAATTAGGTAPYAVRFFAAVDGGAPAQVGADVTAAPYQLNLGPLAPGSYVFHAEATDAASGTALSATRAITVANLLAPVTQTLIPAGSAWKYLDDGSDQGAAWRAPAFGDSAWAQGPAPLGYGDPWIVTTVYSPAAPNRTITTYFRKTIQIERPALFSEVKLRCMRDDGVVVYVNGVEVWRSNMPEGEINYMTFSSTIVGGADETTWYEATVPPALLVPGNNVVAVELHQRDGTSSDLSFDFQLLATVPGGVPNEPPAVDAGADLTVVLPAGATLNGVATDDGLPVPPGAMTVAWSKVSGPGTVTFGNPASATTTATFGEPGEYVLRLEASDGAAETADECVVTVEAVPAPSLAVIQPVEKKVVVTNETATFTFAGTAANVEGDIRLVNSLGGDAVQPASTAWTFADVPLAVGVNRLTITASNAVGTVAEKITVIRQAAPAVETLRMAVFSDPHYFAPELLISDGPAFQMYLAQDRKLIAESAALVEETVDQLIAQNADVVLVAGDLTKDGEMDSHLGFAAELARLAAAGAQVLVVPGNHDVSNPHAFAYDGAATIPVANVSPAEFRAIYAPFGYDVATAVDSNSLAYTVDPLPDLRILCMDPCQYASGDGHTAGSFDAQRLAWITNHLAAARAEGRMVLGMMHHGLMEHFQGQKSVFAEYVVDEWETVAALFAEQGMRAVFTGHFHANDIVKGTFGGKDIYDIETGSTVTWPCPYRVMELDADGTLAIATHHVTEIAYDLGGAPDFQTYAHDYLVGGLLALSSYMLQAPPYNLPPATANYLAPAFAEAMLLHYAGDEPGLAGATPATQAIVMNLLGSGDPLQIMLGQALYAMLTDLAPADGDATLALVRPPFVVIQTPTDGATLPVAQTSVEVSVAVEHVAGELTYANVTMGVTLQSAGMAVVLPLQPGANELTVTGTNALGEVAVDSVLVTRVGGPVPDVKANGSDDPIVIGSGDLLSVTLSLDTAGYAGLWADWWVLAYHADSNQWYQYVAPFTTTSWRPWTGGTSLQAPLYDVAGHEALMTDLPAGQWTFYFGVDAPQDGTMDMDMLFHDGVSVTVTP